MTHRPRDKAVAAALIDSGGDLEPAAEILGVKPSNLARRLLKSADLREARIIGALKAAHGVVRHAAEILGISRSTLYRRIRENPRIGEKLGEAREHMKDLAETRLFDLIEGRNVSAIRFYLTTQAKERGYGGKEEPAVAAATAAPDLDLSHYTKEELEALLRVHDAAATRLANKKNDPA